MKRIFDLCVALTLLVLLSPMIMLTGAVIKLRMGSPVLFKQRRPGLDGKPFFLYKFRTMLDIKDTSGTLLSDYLRLTKIGIFMRRYSLDEFPQLINVIKGDMSLVGPRPLLMEYLPLYTKKQLNRYKVRPGITGWAQVNGRNTITWEEKFKLDVWYVNNQSFLLDLKILFLTFVKVIKSEGINNRSHETMPVFRGTRNYE